VLPRFDDGSGKIVYQVALYLGLHLLPHTYQGYTDRGCTYQGYPDHGYTYWDHTYWRGT
jgi:hypothetical protein